MATDMYSENDTISASFKVTANVHDVGVAEIINPIGNIDSAGVLIPQAKVKNYSLQTETFGVKFTIGGPLKDVWSDDTLVTLLGGDSLLIDFDPWAAGPRGTYAARCSTELATDVRPGNDTLGSAFTIKVHDYAATEITYPDAPVDSGDVVQPKAWIYNYGTEDETDVLVTFYIEGTTYASTKNISLTAGGSIEQTFDGFAADFLRGSYTMRCTTKLNSDLVASNNLTTNSVLILAHDAGVIEIIAPTGSTDTAATYVPQAKVKNFGNVTDEFNVRFTIEGPLKDVWYDDTTVTVNAQDSLSIDFASWTIGPRGSYTAKCSTYLTTDMYPENDIVSALFNIDVRDVGTISIIQPVREPDSTETIIPKAVVKNFGTVPVTFDAKFTVIGTTTWENTQLVADLNPGDEVTIEFDPWPVGLRGGYTARCSTQLATDNNTANDELDSLFTIQVRDYGAAEISYPNAPVDSAQTIQPRAWIYNYGTTDETDVPVTFYILGTSYTSTKNVSLTAGSSLEQTFDGFTLNIPRGSYTMRCTTQLNGDLVVDNNFVIDSFKVIVHDVSTTEIIQPTGNIDSTAQIIPRAKVKNLGSEKVTFDAIFTIIGATTSWNDDQLVTDLDTNEERIIEFASWPITRGSYTAKCSTALADDDNPYNDKQENSFTVKVRDYCVSSISSPIGRVDSSATIQPKAWICNYGTTDETDVPVTFYIVGTSYSSTKNVSLTAGSSIEQTFDDFTANLPPGPYAMRCTTQLDGDFVVDNNLAIGSFEVVVHDVGTIAILYPNNNFDSTAFIIPQAQVENFGSATDTFNVKFSIIGPAKTTWFDDTTVILNANATLTIDFAPWTVGLHGNYTAKCSTELTADIRPDNDRQDFSFTVIPVILGWSQLRKITTIPTLPSIKGIKDGAGLVTLGDSLYAMQGNNLRNFYVYNHYQDTWYRRESLPYRMKSNGTYDKKKVRAGGGITVRNGIVYAFKGGGTNELWAYLPANDSWIRRCTIPTRAAGATRATKIQSGASLTAMVGFDSIYAFKGGSTNEFWLYSINQDTWFERAPLWTPDKKVRAGGKLVAKGCTVYAFVGGSTKYFYAYTNGAWERRADTRFGNGNETLRGIGDGSAMAVINNRVYAFKGANTQIFGSYDPVTNRWYTVRTDTIPRGVNKKRVSIGGSLTAFGNKLYAFKGGNTQEFWCYTFAADDITQARASTISSDMTGQTLTAQNFSFKVAPNPFSNLATIRYTLPVSGKVTIKLYNTTGRLIHALLDEYQNTGSYTLNIDNWKLKIAKGVYFLKYEDQINRAEIKLIIE
jgi:hypothetical protein